MKAKIIRNYVNLKKTKGMEQRVWLGEEKYLESVDFMLNGKSNNDPTNPSLIKEEVIAMDGEDRTWNWMQFTCAEKLPLVAMFHSMVNIK
jgi:hypothetical protein